MEQTRAVTPSLTILDAKVALQFLKDHKSVNLNGYHYIDAKAARILSGRTFHFMLSRIKVFFLGGGGRDNSPYACDLYLSGLKSLSVEAAEALATRKGEIGARKGKLDLNGLESLSVEAAEALATSEGCFHLNGLTNISVEVAKALATHKGVGICLSGLKSISAEAAEALAAHKGELDPRKGGGLYLDGLTNISVEVAKALATYKGSLFLNGLKSLSQGVAKALAAHKGWFLCLNGLKSLSVEAAEGIAAHKGRQLLLHGLTNISVEVAKALDNYQEELEVRNLSVEETAWFTKQYARRAALRKARNDERPAGRRLAGLSMSGRLPRP